MIFSIDGETDELEPIAGQEFSELDILEYQDLQQWVIEEPRILGEDLLIITSEYTGFQDVQDRLDVLALDLNGKLVVVELKRDRADRTTDLQAIKYASYCATLTAEDVQQEYRDFWNERTEESVSPEEVGQRFAEFLDITYEEEGIFTKDGWAEFELDQKPRILLAAGAFGTEVTSPVMWLIEEYGIDITCTRIEAYRHQDRILLSSQQVIPVSEAEEYMAKRREKQDKQESKAKRSRAIKVLLDREILRPGDTVVFCEQQVPTNIEARSEDEGIDPPTREYDPEDNLWRAEVTGDTGQSDNVRWLHDDEVYSFTGLTKELLHELVGRPKSKSLNGHKYWCHPELENRSLHDLRESDVRNPERGED